MRIDAIKIGEHSNVEIPDLNLNKLNLEELKFLRSHIEQRIVEIQSEDASSYEKTDDEDNPTKTENKKR